MARIASFKALDRRLERLGRPALIALALGGVGVIGLVDYLTGYEVSLSLLYLGPVALGAWYAGRWTGNAISTTSCVVWYVADVAAGHTYSHAAIPAWNAVVRLGFFLVTAELLTLIHAAFLEQRQLAQTDALTGLYSRRAFDDRLRHDLALAQRRGRALTLAYVDLDDFKLINDRQGHAAGDRVLREIGRTLKQATRKSDTAARIGGDEFALVLPDTDSSGAQQVVARLRRSFQKAPGAGEVTCSIGVVTFLDATTSAEAATAAVDELMYKVKRESKGTAAFSVRGEPARHEAAGGA